MPSSLSTISCASWLVYAKLATDERAKQVKSLILKIKTDSVHVPSGLPVVQVVIERIAAHSLSDAAREVFSGDPVLVPVPRSSLTRPNTVWPALRVCEELARQGLGHDILAAVSRTTAVPKSAGNASRPPIGQQLSSLTVQGRLRPPSRLLLVDDVVTSGATMMACAIRLAEAFPGVPVNGFALARVQSTGNPLQVLQPLVERITVKGQRCVRGAAS